MSPFPSLRKLHATDAAWLAALHAACFDKTRAWSEDLFASFLVTPAAYGCALVKDGNPVAFILGQGAGDEAEIVTLATHPAVQRQGFAEILVNNFCEAMKSHNKTRLFLEVAVNNLAAIGLYTKRGFTRNGQRRDYYREADGTATDALIMQKVLTD